MAYDLTGTDEKQVRGLIGNCSCYLTAKDRFSILEEADYSEEMKSAILPMLDFDGPSINVVLDVLKELKLRNQSSKPYIASVIQHIDQESSRQDRIRGELEEILDRI
jgi:hypothetical protein